ncbi:MAG: UDP-N-acetylglucosamine--N-acetylmuramyl-(pentapeptide) pyrophosphoryl-undecaprenol N-acetylglucosamine transferase [Candidatus Caenarcaniphilales bacterium]|nr:UDP-N-acetylglucosamine--N-acetylmuramyl-(pentapeptide) pyrophosphoryl-undecaprenol N-acetylglucosamine transferase [Candidatus Caenarcaniphilales bacterium]
MNKEKKEKTFIAFTGGGTGGHVYPNIAVYEALKKKNSKLEFVYFGSDKKIEKEVCEKNNISFFAIPLTGGMPRSPKIVVWIFKFLFSFFKTLLIVQKTKPKIIFGTGGYIAAPVFLSAIILKIPYIIHNLDAHMGLANAAFIKEAKALTLGMKLASKVEAVPLDGPTIITGNPIRQAFYSQNTDLKSLYKNLKLDSKRKTLVITGGSQGAQVLNETIIEAAPDLIENKWQIVHQLGPLQYDSFKERFPESEFYRPEKFINNLDELYSIADLAISRSGAMSVAELMARQVPTIYIPLPTAAQNHQFHNAKYVEELGGGIIIEQKDLSKSKLKDAINLVYDRRHLFKMGLQAASTINPAETIADLILRFL